MGVYWVQKPFTRKSVDDGRAIMRPGTKITLELRSEALELLQGGFISREPVPREIGEVLEGQGPRKTLAPVFDDAQLAQLKEFATKAGMPMDGAKHQILRRMSAGVDFATAYMDARRANGLLTWKEQVEEAAAAFGEPEAELQAELTELSKTFKLTLPETIKRLRLARELKQEPAGIFAEIQRRVERESLTPAEAMDVMRAAAAPKPEVPKLPDSMDPGSATPAAVQAAVAEKGQQIQQERRAKRKAKQQTENAPA